MTWNYRRLSERADSGDIAERHFYIAEVYYDGDAVTGWTKACQPYGETPDELRSDMEMMMGALDLPVLDVTGETVMEMAAE